MVERSLFDIESIVQDVVYLYDLLPTDKAESLVQSLCDKAESLVQSLCDLHMYGAQLSPIRCQICHNTHSLLDHTLENPPLNCAHRQLK